LSGKNTLKLRQIQRAVDSSARTNEEKFDFSLSGYMAQIFSLQITVFLKIMSFLLHEYRQKHNATEMLTKAEMY